MILNSPYISGSSTITGNLNVLGSISGSTNSAISASYALNATSASYALNSTATLSSSYAATSSYADTFTVAGTLTAQKLVVQTITSSIVYSSGSNVFGNSLSNTQVMTGSVGITGSLAVVGASTFTGTTGDRVTIYNNGNNSVINGLKIDSDVYPGITFNSRDSLAGSAVIGNGKLVYNSAATGYGADSLGGAIILQGSNAVQFSTNGDNVRLTITSGGNVGIGTSSPSAKLQVLGGTITTNTQSTYALGVGNSSGYDLTFGTDASFAYIQSWASKPLQINNQGNNLILNATAGNVLIGTTTDAGFKLDVNGTGRFSGSLIAGNTATSSSQNKIGTIHLGASGGGYPVVGYNIEYTASGNVYNRAVVDYTWAIDFGNSDQFRVFRGAAGSAGGAITQVAALTIASTGAATFSSTINSNNITIANTSTTSLTLNASASTFQDLIYFKQAGTSRWEIGTDPNATPGFSFYSYGTSSTVFSLNYSTGAATFTGTIGDRITLYNSGNNSGTNGIYIDSDIYPAIRFNNRVGNAGTAKIVYNTYATGYGAASLNGSFLMQGPNALQFSSGGDNVRMTIASGGDVIVKGSLADFTIGSSGAELFFGRNSTNYITANGGGGAEIRIISNTNGVVLANGGTSWGSLSDENSKDIIEPIVNACDNLSQIRTIIGKYKTDDKDKRRLFLIAQDIEKVYPEAVFKIKNKEEEESLALNYQDLIPVLVKAIQELKAEIDLLKALIK
jgi:fibronectin-binding autotransporter adhesin